MDLDEIQEVVLAELEVKDASVVHRNNVKLLLQAVAPRAKLTLLPLQLVPPLAGRCDSLA